MDRSNRTLLSFLGAALACAAIAGPVAAREGPPPSGTSRTSSSMSGRTDAQAVIGAWPVKTKKAAQALIEKYGQPDGVTDRLLTWNDKDPWLEVAVYRDAVAHSLPRPHMDFIENKIRYDVPADKLAELTKFDRALVVDLTRGTLASHCDSEKANILALNLANEIVTGKRDAASAESFQRTTMMKSMAGKSSPYTDKLMFTGSPRQANPTEEPATKRDANPAPRLAPTREAPPLTPAQSPETGY